jgi:hypothetical protein
VRPSHAACEVQAPPTWERAFGPTVEVGVVPVVQGYSLESRSHPGAPGMPGALSWLKRAGSKPSYAGTWTCANAERSSTPVCTPQQRGALASGGQGDAYQTAHRAGR